MSDAFESVDFGTGVSANSEFFEPAENRKYRVCFALYRSSGDNVFDFGTDDKPSVPLIKTARIAYAKGIRYFYCKGQEGSDELRTYEAFADVNQKGLRESRPYYFTVALIFEINPTTGKLINKPDFTNGVLDLDSIDIRPIKMNQMAYSQIHRKSILKPFRNHDVVISLDPKNRAFKGWEIDDMSGNVFREIIGKLSPEQAKELRARVDEVASTMMVKAAKNLTLDELRQAKASAASAPSAANNASPASPGASSTQLDAQLSGLLDD